MRRRTTRRSRTAAAGLADVRRQLEVTVTAGLLAVVLVALLVTGLWRSATLSTQGLAAGLVQAIPAAVPGVPHTPLGWALMLARLPAGATRRVAIAALPLSRGHADLSGRAERWLLVWWEQLSLRRRGRGASLAHGSC